MQHFNLILLLFPLLASAFRFNSLPFGPDGNLTLPSPTLTPDFRIIFDLGQRVAVGPGPWGQRNWIPFTGGRWVAKWGAGTIVDGGQDSQVVIGDLSARVEPTYVLKTADETPAYILVKGLGWRTGRNEVLQKLGNPLLADTVKPSEYKFFVHVQMETGDVRYNHTNTKMWIARGAKLGSKVVLDGYVL
ncbi:hypothetical protein FN846DRAFT_920092 [Sphaerosporella brunnea]|uniref:Uncharacterized protein n=1 Tax=Sphaerosporella brunnea TaxID=1250544 RepID=A0A5J5ETK7_9PEZI|nr:hypothetical protein FN846DRAFT_920092 [Sphaerosporella brunnea]